MEQSKRHLNELVNQNILFIFGNHDCGKSTLANAFLAKTIQKSADKGLQAPDLMYKNLQMFKIKYLGEESCDYIEYAPSESKKQFYLVEYPYPGNSRFEKQFGNY